MALDQRNEREQLRQLEHVCADRDFARALVLSETVLRDFPQSFSARLQYARILKELNRLEEAGRLLADLDIQFGGNLNVLVELGDLYFRQKRYIESRDVFQRVLFLDSFNRRAKATLGYIERVLENPAADKMEDTSVEMRLSRGMLESDPAAVAPSEPLTGGEEILLGAAEEVGAGADVRPVAINFDDELADPDRRPTLAEEEFDAAFAKLETGRLASQPSMLEEDLAAMFDIPAGLPETETAADNSPVVRIDFGDAGPAEVVVADPVPRTTAFAAAHVSEPAPAPAAAPLAAAENILTFDTESAADLYFQQGLYDEAEAIYAKLFQQTGRDEYEAKIEEIARLRKTERALRIIEKMLAFLQAVQKRGSQRV